MSFNQKEIDSFHKEFSDRLEGMLDLLSLGRGIEILIRIADQTQEGLAAVDESYEAMMSSSLKIRNLHPPQALPHLFTDIAEREQLLLARDIADKLAHALYFLARTLIDEYRKKYGLTAQTTAAGFPGWKIQADGYLIEEDGRRVKAIENVITSSPENLIIEEFDVFVHNGYDDAAREIFDAAWRKLTSRQSTLAIDAAKLHMFRGFRRGTRTYV